MRACVRCGTEISDDAIYCQRCEHLVGTTASMPSLSSSQNVRPNRATDLEPQTRQRRRQRSFLASLLLLLGVRRNPRTGSPGCAFWPTLSVALTAALIIGFITGPVLKLFPPFSPNSPSIQVTFGSAGSVNVHGANFPARSRIYLILDGVGTTFPPTSHPSISQSLYNISFYVDQVKTIQQIKQPSFANSIIVRDDGTFDAQIDIPKNWQPDSQHVIEAQAVGQDGHAQTQVQQTVTMPAESSGGVLSSPTPTPTPTLTPTPTPTPTLTPTVPPSAQLPVVSNLDQKSGPVAGGTTVTISGSGFIGATSFSFGKAMVDCAVSSCKVNSDGTQITVTSPVEDSFDTPGPVDVIVTNSVGHSAQSSADQFTYIPLPIVTGINPSSGSPNGGTPVTINGSGFTNATVVSFDSTSVIFNFVSDSQITATSPAGNGIVDVTVTTPNGTSQTNGMDTFTYDVAPVPDPTPTVSVLGG